MKNLLAVFGIGAIALASFLVGYGIGALALDVEWSRPRRVFGEEVDAAQDAGA